VKDDRVGLKELLHDVDLGLDVLYTARHSDWFNWSSGSTLIFWHWPKGFQRTCAKNGMPPWVHATLPRHKRPAKKPKAEDAVLLLPKFERILSRGYVTIATYPSELKSLIDYFYVPKDSDIHPVYNGSSCKMNQALWALNFWLPMAKSALQVLGRGYYSVDIDLGEFFPFPRVTSKFFGNRSDGLS
jgi:hypothetical protein